MSFPQCRWPSILTRGTSAAAVLISLWAHAAVAAPALIGLTVGGSSDTLVSINPSTGALTTIGSGLPDGFTNDSYALNSANSLYYYETYVPLNGPYDLNVVNTATGALVGSHALSTSLIAMAYDSVTGTLLGLTSGDSLVSINPTTAALTTLASGLPNGLSNEAFALNPTTGILFYQTAGSKLNAVNATTGALIGSYNLSNGLSSLTYDSVTGTLLALSYGSSEQLVSVSATGQLTTIGSNLPAILTDFANAFDPVTGQFYYEYQNQLIVVNATTGVKTGNPTLSSDLYGIAVPSAVAAPEPAGVAVLLVGLGTLGLVQHGSRSRRRREPGSTLAAAIN